jgi:hypothetical protein
MKLSPMELVICSVPAVFVLAIVIIVIYAIRPKPTTTKADSQAIVQEDSQTSNKMDNESGSNASTEITSATQNGLAITSLAVSILAIIIYFLLGPTWSNCMGPLAMLIGAISLMQIRKQGSKGKGVAIAGIVLGTLPFIITLVSILLLSATVLKK